MQNSNQNFPVASLFMNSADRFYPALAGLVASEEGHIDAQPAVSQVPTWWGRSYTQGSPVVGGRYVFLRGAWLPDGPCAGWNSSASWGTCAPSTGEAC